VGRCKHAAVEAEQIRVDPKRLAAGTRASRPRDRERVLLKTHRFEVEDSQEPVSVGVKLDERPSRMSLTGRSL